jgi:general stress protein CsbA
MDNKAFEIKMIDTVNRQADVVEHNRMVAESAARERRMVAESAARELDEFYHRVDVVRAITEIVCLVLLLVAITYAFCSVNWISTVAVVSMTTMCGFVIGMRVNALSRIFKK